MILPRGRCEQKRAKAGRGLNTLLNAERTILIIKTNPNNENVEHSQIHSCSGRRDCILYQRWKAYGAYGSVNNSLMMENIEALSTPTDNDTGVKKANLWDLDTNSG